MNREDVSILVVDDVNALRVRVQEMLQGFGFRKVKIAANGAEARQLLATEGPFQLILCDWQMTPSDGMDLLTFVRGNASTAQTAFVMVTAENTRDRVIQAIASGVDDYLIKPLTMEQIQEKVYGALKRRKVLE